MNDSNYTRRVKTLARSADSESSAWDVIGEEGCVFRIKGGRAFYEEVNYNCATGGHNVRLGRVDTCKEGLAVVERYVAPDTTLEVWRLREGEWA